MKKIVFVYDDIVTPSKEIQNITGGKSFGNTIYKRKTLRERTLALLQGESAIERIEDYRRESLPVRSGERGICVVHLFSMFGLQDEKAFHVLLEKARYAKTPYRAECMGKVALSIFPDAQSYEAFILEHGREDLQAAMLEFSAIASDAFYDISETEGFLRFLTGGFDARFFNALKGDEFTVTKSSSNQAKIQAEYQFYQLLPEHMKMWFVMPFGYQESGGQASYMMERYHMTDIAIRYVHGAVSAEELGDILHKLFTFLRTRHEKRVTEEEYEKNAKALYVDKVKERLTTLKTYALYDRLNALLAAGTDFNTVDEVVAAYEALYASMLSGRRFQPVLVVGHGDLCFSNILYHREASIIKLIDPKGAVTEEGLYMNPYYDIAKLSHSICGSYDFFNSGLYQITVEEDMRFKLSVDHDNRTYRELFERALTENGYDHRLVRLYEASLFLSMLPLHIDQEKKVFAFLLNAIMIMEELKGGR